MWAWWGPSDARMDTQACIDIHVACANPANMNWVDVTTLVNIVISEKDWMSECECSNMWVWMWVQVECGGFSRFAPMTWFANAVHCTLWCGFIINIAECLMADNMARTEQCRNKTQAVTAARGLGMVAGVVVVVVVTQSHYTITKQEVQNPTKHFCSTTAVIPRLKMILL